MASNPDGRTEKQDERLRSPACGGGLSAALHSASALQRRHKYARGDFTEARRHPLSPFVLSLSKQGRTLKVVNELSNPYPSTTPISVHTDFVETHRRHLFPFVLSLSKYERTLKPFQSLPFDKLRANGLERYSPTRFLRQAQSGAG
jgi:hypothetical protein